MVFYRNLVGIVQVYDSLTKSSMTSVNLFTDAFARILNSLFSRVMELESSKVSLLFMSFLFSGTLLQLVELAIFMFFC